MFYFLLLLAGNYKKELNPQNPLGMKGEIAKAYAELLHQMWSGYNSYVSPRNFKVCLRLASNEERMTHCI